MHSLYVHFPWCVAKCPYCDFNSHPVRDPVDQIGYVNALLADFYEQQQTANRPIALSTVFFGGGTPSLFSPAALEPLMNALQPFLVEHAEITMEANPGSQEHWDFAGYRSIGINRLSLGAQSFNAVQLKTLGRIHAAADTKRAFHAARTGGFDNINLDLMYALPNQALDSAMDDLDQALALQPEHLSWYQLTIEPKTEFAGRPPILPVDETVYQIEQQGYERLQSANMGRYEISAYATPDRQCAHNLNYWRNGDYLGIGAGAHGKVTSQQEVLRTNKASQPRLYLDAPMSTNVAAVAAADLCGELAMNALRLIDGVNLTGAELDVVECLGQGVLQPAALNPALEKIHRIHALQVERELMQPQRFAATPLGLRFLDSLVAEFL